MLSLPERDPVTAATSIPRTVIASWSVAGCALVFAVVTLVLQARNAALVDSADEVYLTDVWVGMIGAAVGAFLISRRHAQLLGAVLLSTALVAVGAFGGAYATYVHAGQAGSAPGADLAAWLAAWGWTPYLLLPSVVPLLYPTGRPKDRFWRRVMTGMLAAVAVVAVLAAFYPGPIEGYPRVVNPLGLTAIGSFQNVTDPAIGVVAVGGGILGLAGLVARWRSSGGQARSRLLRLTVAFGFFVTTLGIGGSFTYPWNDFAQAVGITVVLVVLAANTHLEASHELGLRSAADRRATRQRERLRVHRDLHDGLGPELVGVSMQLRALESQVTDSTLRDGLRSVDSQLREAIQAARQLIDDTAPSPLAGVDLVTALQRRAEALEQSGTRFSIAGIAPRAVAPEVMDAAFWIASEAMTNVAKHAKAAAAVVTVGVDGDVLAISVEDDGNGRPAIEGNGFGTMRARATDVGGSVHVESTPGVGTAVHARLPIR